MSNTKRPDVAWLQQYREIAPELVEGKTAEEIAAWRQHLTSSRFPQRLLAVEWQDGVRAYLCPAVGEQPSREVLATAYNNAAPARGSVN